MMEQKTMYCAPENGQESGDAKPSSACFTGHRVISANKMHDVKAALDETIVSLVNQGVTAFFNGGAMGFDLLAAERVIAFKMLSGLPIKLILILPCEGHSEKWGKENKSRLLAVMQNAEELICLSERYYDGCMEARNRQLVEHSDVCVAYLTRECSGTSQTVRLARERGMRVVNLAERKKEQCFMADFETAFGKFIDGKQYGKAEESLVELLFNTAFSSFRAGWVAAGGESPPSVEGIRSKNRNFTLCE